MGVGALLPKVFLWCPMQHLSIPYIIYHASERDQKNSRVANPKRKAQGQRSSFYWPFLQHYVEITGDPNNGLPCDEVYRTYKIRSSSSGKAIKEGVELPTRVHLLLGKGTREVFPGRYLMLWFYIIICVCICVSVCIPLIYFIIRVCVCLSVCNALSQALSVTLKWMKWCLPTFTSTAVLFEIGKWVWKETMSCQPMRPDVRKTEIVMSIYHTHKSCCKPTGANLSEKEVEK